MAFRDVQVTFYNHLTPEVRVELKQDLIAFATDGANVFVELCRMEGRDDFIDVLVSFQNSSVDDAIEWMEENLLKKMRKVFAESRGIPGADITYGVVRPACIRSSVEASARSVVSKDRLRNILRENLEKRGSRIVDNGTINLTFTWQTTPPTHDPLQSLLGSAEVMKIVKDYEEFLKAATYFANPGLIDNDVSPSESRSSEIREDATEHDFGESSSTKELGYIYNAFRGDMEKNFQQVHRNLEIVKSDLKTLMDQVKILLCQVEDLRSTVLSGLQKIFRYLEESEAGALPRIFVLAVDDGTVRRLVTKLIPKIHYYKLHLLCECPNEQVHFLEEGYGLQIAALDDDALLKRGLPYLKTLLRIAYIAVKVSAHAAAGAGELVPDFTKMLSSSSLDFEGTSELPTRSNLQEGHQWLRDVLNRRHCLGGEEIHRAFGLRRIRCPDGRVAWVCDAHYFMGKPYPA
ncbi:hypothetical protein KP509_18G016500 [Ceratopteris richardii]|uniref:Uncharacterized protein n=1 Tax=Ceratopteris richardii TaxID=49495 RepID=A0A8T2SRG6_CERRI|nr:hypothetical protein KP509_18G016500 [Ceratopteris richardii]